MKDIKCVVVGDAAVGKTCLLTTFTMNAYSDNYSPTVFDHCSGTVMVDEKTINLNIFDSAGLSKYDRLRALSYFKTNVVLICFSIDSPDSFDNVKTKWHPEIQQHCPAAQVILVGLKVDLRDDRRIFTNLIDTKSQSITCTQGRSLAKEINAAKYLECSSYMQEGVKSVFYTAVTTVLQLDIAVKRVAKRNLES